MDRDEGRRERWVWPAAKLVTAAALTVLLATSGAAQAQSGGPEIPVNTTTAGGQGGDILGVVKFGPAIAADGSGGFTVAWGNWEGFGTFLFSAGPVYARHFDAAGAPLSGEIQVNTTTAGWRFEPAIAAGSSGGFTVAWASDGQDGSGYGVYARRFAATGAPLSGEIPVNTTTAGSQSEPAIAADGSGGFTVAWTNWQGGIYARRFDAAGAPLSGEIPVNTTTADDQSEPAIAADGSGGFTVAWASYGQDGSGWGVYARRFDAAGAPLTGEIPVNMTTANHQSYPAIAADGSGGFTVAWTSNAQDGSDNGVYARRFAATGAPLSGEIPVNATTAGSQFEPTIAADGSGGFTATWTSGGIFNSGVFARRFDAAGAPLTGEIPVNTTTAYMQIWPAIAADGSGGFTVAWASLMQFDPSYDFDVYARRFLADVPDTRIDSGPAEGSSINDPTPTFEFSSSGEDSSFECRLDGGGFSACSSPLTTSPLADGPHSFEVRATDGHGHTDPWPASRSFTVDTVAPDTQINSGPPEGSRINDPTPTFQFSSSEQGSSFECRLDGGGFSACSSPLTTSPLADGTHSFEVRARDAAANPDPSPASRSFTVDTVAPDTRIDSGPAEGASINDPTPTFEFSSSEQGSSFECRLDGGGFSACSSPLTTSPLADGTHSFEVRARDAAANPDPSPAARSFTVDTRPPVAGPTGKRAAALKKCKKKFPGEAKAKKRKKCIGKAKKLPV